MMAFFYAIAHFYNNIANTFSVLYYITALNSY